MPKESNLEFKVGLFVMLALGAFAVFLFSISDFSSFEQGNTYKVIFNFANGIKKSAPVRIAGVDAGLVKTIQIYFDSTENKTKVKIEIWVKKAAQIPIDSKFSINQLGLLGEKYIEINPGLNQGEFIADGAVIVGKDPISQERIAERVMEVAGKLESSVASLSDMLKNEENQNAVSGTLKNLHSITGGVDLIVKHVQSGEGTIGKLFYDQNLYDDLHSLTSDLKANPWKLLYRPK